MPTRKKHLRHSATLLALLWATSAHADTFNWIGTPTSNIWTNPANWLNLTDPTSSSYPTASDTALLDTGGYNSINLLSPELFVDTLQFPGAYSPRRLLFSSSGSPPYTLSSNNGTGSTLLHVNHIAGSSTLVFPLGFSNGNPSIVDATVTLLGPDTSTLDISLTHDLAFQGPVIAPSGITVSSGILVTDGGTLSLYNASNSIASLNLAGQVNAYGPGSIQNTIINFGLAPFESGALTLISDSPIANYGNNINSGGPAFIRVSPTVSNSQPFGDPASSIFRLGNVSISAPGSYFSGTFQVDNDNTHDTLQFQNLDIAGPAVLMGVTSSYNGPHSVAQFSSLTGHITPPPPDPGCGLIILQPTSPGPTSLIINGGEFDFAGAGNFPAPITVQSGLLVAQSDGALGTGPISVNPSGALRFDVPQSTLPTITVAAGGALGGNLTGASYGSNITLADGAILFPTAGPLPSRPPTGPVYYRGIDSLTSTFTVGDDGTSSIYRGAAFGPFTPDGPFTGTLNEAAPGAGIQILAAGYTAIGDPSTNTSATFNSSSDVSITLTGTNELDLFTPLAGTARVFNLYASNGHYNLGPGTIDLLGSGVIPSGYTVNVQSGTLYMFTQADAVSNGAKVNVMPGAIFAEWGNTSPTSGNFEIKPGGMLSLFAGDAASGANFIFDPGSIVELLTDVNDSSWIPPLSDLYIDGGVNQIGAGLQLSPSQTLSTITSGQLSNTPITPRPDAPADATFKFTSYTGNTQYGGLSIYSPVTFSPGQTLQIGDTTPSLYNNEFPNGTVAFLGNVVSVDHLHVVSGTLLLGSSNNTPAQINANSVTLSPGTTLAGTGIINANQLTIAGTLASQNLQVNANTTLLPGSSIQWQLLSATSSYFFSDTSLPWSQFSVTGLLTIDPNAPASPILIIPQSVDAYGNLSSYIDFDPAQPYTFPFIQATSILNFDPADFAFDLSQFTTPYTGTWSIQQSSPTELDLVYTPALPEPATLLLLTLLPLRRRPIMTKSQWPTKLQ